MWVIYRKYGAMINMDHVAVVFDGVDNKLAFAVVGQGDIYSVELTDPAAALDCIKKSIVSGYPLVDLSKYFAEEK